MTADASRRRAKSAPPPASEAAQRYAAGLIEQAAEICLPDLFPARAKRSPGDRAIYRSRARRSIQVVAVATDALREEELMAVMRYRLAQYIAVHFVDLERIYDERIEFEPLDHTSAHDVHILACHADSGEILCYMTMKQIKGAPPEATFRTQERPLFPAEEVHGWGIFNRLELLPDFPVNRVREIGRFVKNWHYPSPDERAIRGPLEVSLALWRLLTHELRPEVDAVVGDFEEGVAQQSLAYFHVPVAVLHGTVPYEAETAWLYRRYQHRTVFPFAILSDDLNRVNARNVAIDRALSLPGRLALIRLAWLRHDMQPPPSSFEPPGGLPALDEALVLDQPDVAMSDRLQLIDAGHKLRSAPLFADLSVAEATVLGTLLERVAVEPGTTILREGDEGDALYVVESGTVEVRRGDVRLAELGPGDYFGEIALITGGTRTADVVALTTASILRLSRAVYLDYLAALPEVKQKTGDSSAARLAAARGGSSRSAPVADVLSDLTSAAATVLGKHMERRTVLVGEVIVRQGDAGDALYMIISGDAEVAAHDGAGQRHTMATLGPGDFFGEIALLADMPRIADVVALTPMAVLRLDSGGFDAFLKYSERARVNLGEAAVRRARATARQLEPAE